MNFMISEMYTLKLSWDEAIYTRPGVCDLVNATLSGPALRIAQKMQPNEFIYMDFYRQYFIITHNIYVGKLSWGEVVYNSNGTVTLKNATISSNSELNRMPQFKKTDYIIIDTSKHEVGKHNFNLLYESFVINEYNELYNFG